MTGHYKSDGTAVLVCIAGGGYNILEGNRYLDSKIN